MALSRLSDECYDGPVRGIGFEGHHAADHDRCPGGHTTPGILGGWVCSCECHRAASEPSVDRCPTCRSDDPGICLRDAGLLDGEGER